MDTRSCWVESDAANNDGVLVKESSVAGDGLAPIPGADEARHLFLFIIVAGGIGLTVFLFHLAPRLMVPVAYSVPLFPAIGLLLTIRLARHGATEAPLSWVIPMSLFVVAGAAFDMIATVHHTPDLELEGNPIARALLDSGQSLAAVYAVALVGQIFYAALLCALWIAFLKHRPSLVESLRHERSPLAFFKSATGGRKLTWRQWLCPLRVSELPEASYYVWVITVLLLSGVADRWYLGLEWYGYVSQRREMVLIVASTCGFCGYLIWLWYASRPAVSAECPIPATALD